MKKIFPLLLPLLFIACASPQAVVEQRYDTLGDRSFQTLFENEHAALVVAKGEDENCTYSDLYVVLNVPPENRWQIRDTEYRKSCDKRQNARIEKEYRMWKADRAHNAEVWHPGAKR